MIIQMNKSFLKFVLLMNLLIFLGLNLFSQKVYMSINYGYGFGTSTQNKSEFINYSSDHLTTSYEQINFSFGRGFNIGSEIGIILNKNIRAELDISYLIGNKIKSYSRAYAISNTILSSKMIRFNPSFILSSGFDKLDPYAKFGVIVGVGSIFIEETDTYGGGSDMYYFKNKLNGGIAFGLSSCIGVQFKLTNSLSVYSEINMINLSYAPKKGKLIKSTYNGQDMLPNTSISKKETEFVKKYIYDEANPPLDSEPTKELKEKYPFGSIGLNIGLIYNF
jgi:hypothetical protein